jgi:GNAT superfamily N-acetyltransferase
MSTPHRDELQVSIHRAVRSDAPVLAGVIRTAFQDIAERFGLGPENAPTHPSNCDPTWILTDLEQGVSYCAASVGGTVLGCVAVAPISAELTELKRLAVLPSMRRRGIGRRLVGYGVEQARSTSARRVTVGIIAGHTELAAWYLSLGFLPTHTRRFPQLPFVVAYLEHRL